MHTWGPNAHMCVIEPQGDDDPYWKFGQHFPLHKYKLGYRKDEMEATKLFSYI